ncbi:MAG: ATP-binding cassette domain-containing protein [Pseudomonadota bacterium]|nr:ATP-binding cassette domain-containing protein [Pseudomonadota bacterium]
MDEVNRNAPDTRAGESAEARLEVHALQVSTHAGMGLLHPMSFALPTGMITALIGPEGAGKTLLLRTLFGLTPAAGRLDVAGAVILPDRTALALDNVEYAESVRRSMVWIPSAPAVLPGTLRDNLVYGLRLQGERELRDPVQSILDRLGLSESWSRHLHRCASELNGEQRYLLALARSLVIDPRVVLVDVPAMSLSPAATGRMETLLQDLQQDRVILMATHNLSQAARLSEMCLFLHAGRVMECSPTDRMFTCPERRETEWYLTGRYGSAQLAQSKVWRNHGSR